jgi:hypothetical protein
MDKPLLESTITIEEMTDKEKLVKIKSKEGRTYNVFKTKRDGKPTMAYQQITDMGLQSGSRVDVGYNDSQFTNNSGAQVTSHNIAFFREASVQGKPETDKPDWDEISRGKVRHGVVTAMIQAGKEKDEIFKTTEDYVKYIMGEVQAEANGEPEVDVSDLPF